MTRFVPLLAMLLLSAPCARADTPDSGMAGIWRVIGAAPAPWAKPHALAKAEAPLLEYAFDFADGEVKGGAPLACKHTKYRALVVELKGLFQGKLPSAKAYDIAKAMNLQPPETTDFRVACDGGSFDYYVDHDGNLQMALKDVIYTLQRPEPIETNDVKPGYSGPSFDCLKAKTTADKLICWDAALSKSDSDLAVSYAQLKKSESVEGFAAIQTTQRIWLAYALKSCGATGAMPDNPGDKRTMTDCLNDEYRDRADTLGGAKVLKSGALVLEPRLRTFTKLKPPTSDTDFSPLMSGGPQAAAFNAWIAKSFRLSKRRMDDKDLFAFGSDIPEGMKLYARRTYSVTRFDSKIVSLQVATYDYTGGAHEAIAESALSWDMAKSKPLLLGDVFAKGKAWKKFVSDFCLRDLKDQFAAQQSPEPDAAAIEAVIADGGNWLFAKDHARIHFTEYAIASFAAGEFDVDIPYTTLKPYLKAAAPLL
ncbi:MAG: DUF3298 domain-containing protein [Proteobacteria bacterium]|nr:DUF3298 domain-containing protein [Pseudomonadota bacterium]